MAIDPSISLHAYKPEPVDISKYANLALLGLKAQEMQQNIAESQARIPGVQATSDIKAREAASQKWMQDNAATFTDENGNLNAPGFTGAMTRAGFPEYAIKFSAQHLTQTKNREDYNKEQSAHGAQILSNLPENQRSSRAVAIYERLKSSDPTAAKHWKETFLSEDPETKQLVVSTDKINAARMATMDPQTQHLFEKSKSESFMDEEGQNVNSLTSKAMQDRFIEERGLNPEQAAAVRQMNAFKIDALNKAEGKSITGDSLRGRLPSATERLGAKVEAEKGLADQNSMMRGADNIDAHIKANTGIGLVDKTIAQVLDTITDTGLKNQITHSLSVLERRTGTKIDPTKVQFGGLPNLLRNSAADLTPIIKANSEYAGTQGPVGWQPKTTPSAQQKAPGETDVQSSKPPAQTKNVTRAQVEEFAKRKGKSIKEVEDRIKREGFTIVP